MGFLFATRIHGIEHPVGQSVPSTDQFCLCSITDGKKTILSVQLRHFFHGWFNRNAKEWLQALIWAEKLNAYGQFDPEWLRIREKLVAVVSMDFIWTSLDFCFLWGQGWAKFLFAFWKIVGCPIAHMNGPHLCTIWGNMPILLNKSWNEFHYIT